MGTLSNLIKLVLPKKASTKPVARTNTFNPSLGSALLPVPGYRDHLTDMPTNRGSLDSRQILQNLLKYDADVSAAVFAYLTVADTKPIFHVRDLTGAFDPTGYGTVNQLLQSLGTRTDYSQGYDRTVSVRGLCEQLRYMVLLRGAVGIELVLDKNKLPTRFNQIDMSTVEWAEQEAGRFLPLQRPKSGGDLIDLSKLPTFFTSFFHQDPTAIYAEGPFVSAINTISARQQVINDLYRIMQVTGFPRISITVVEEVLLKNAPANVTANTQERHAWVQARLTEVANTFANLRPDQPFTTTDAITVAVVNDKNPGNGMDISHVINVLNAQNQAALKTMATIIGRGESGVNTASVEARVFSMNADQLNRPVADVLSQVLTFCLRILGSESSVEVDFRPAELRSDTELEPQLALKQSRLLQLLSLGLIDDVEFSMHLTGRPPLAGAPQLSGTGFMTAAAAAAAPAPDVPAGSTASSVARSAAPAGNATAQKMTKSNAVKTG